MTQMYQRVILTRINEDGNTVQKQTMIPQHAAKPGWSMKIKDLRAPGDWSDCRWTVSSVFDDVITEKQAKSKADSWRKYRAATDI